MRIKARGGIKGRDRKLARFTGETERNRHQPERLSLVVDTKRSSGRQDRKCYWREAPTLSPLDKENNNQDVSPWTLNSGLIDCSIFHDLHDRLLMTTISLEV
jgi:hypothetical protein